MPPQNGRCERVLFGFDPKMAAVAPPLKMVTVVPPQDGCCDSTPSMATPPNGCCVHTPKMATVVPPQDGCSDHTPKMAAVATPPRWQPWPHSPKMAACHSSTPQMEAMTTPPIWLSLPCPQNGRLGPAHPKMAAGPPLNQTPSFSYQNLWERLYLEGVGGATGEGVGPGEGGGASGMGGNPGKSGKTPGETSGNRGPALWGAELRRHWTAPLAQDGRPGLRLEQHPLKAPPLCESWDPIGCCGLALGSSHAQ